MDKRFEDYTEEEFLSFLHKLYSASGTEDEREDMMGHFDKVIGHPAGADLILDLEIGEIQDQTPEGVVKFLKKWRNSEGLPGFKE